MRKVLFNFGFLLYTEDKQSCVWTKTNNAIFIYAPTKSGFVTTCTLCFIPYLCRKYFIFPCLFRYYNFLCSDCGITLNFMTQTSL